MLTGTALGAAIESARLKKGISKRTLALQFGVEPPSVQDWVKRGTIDKAKLPALWKFFSDVVEPAHWGLSEIVGPQALGHLPTTEAVAYFVDAVAALPPARWASVRAQLDQLAAHPEMRDDVLAELLTLLQPAPTKRVANAR